MRNRSLLSFPVLLGAALAHADPIWTANGPDGGNIAMIAASPGWLYAATGDGVFRSNDQGANWQRAGTQIARGTGILTVTVSPHDANLVLAGAVGMVYRSTDAGENWSPVAVSTSPTRFVFSSRPIYSNEVFAISTSAIASEPGALLRSSSGGLAWQVVNGPNAAPLLAKGFAADQLLDRYYALDGGQQLLMSENGGSTWIVSGSIAMPANNSRQPLLVDPTDSNFVIWSADNLDASYLQRHRVSSGVTSYVMTTYTANELAGDNGMAGRLWFSAIHEFSTPPQRLYESTDHGQNWIDVNADRPVRMLSADPSVSGRLYGTTGGGPEVSEDAGRHWQTRSSGIPLAPANAVSVDPRDPSVIVAATAGNGVWRSVDGGEHWTQASGLHHRAALSLARSVQDANTLYASSDPGLFRSNDGGSSWIQLPATVFTGTADLRLARILVDRGDANRLVAYHALLSRVGWSDDGGLTWRAATGLDSNAHRIVALPNGSGRVYALGYPHASYPMHRADSHGADFVAVDSAAITHALGVHPYNDARLVALRPGATGTAAYLSNDAGETWQLRGAVPLATAVYESHIRFDPCDPEILYAATGNWVYRSDDLGLTWQQETMPLKSNRFADLEARCANGALVVASASPESSVQVRVSSLSDRILRGGFDG